MYPTRLKPYDVDIHDIAHALAYTCRFNGHCVQFYSVAQHSAAVSLMMEHQLAAQRFTVRDQRAGALLGLLHDASEAYLGDVVAPLKSLELFDAYRAAESRAQVTIENVLLRHIQSAYYGLLDEVDKKMCVTEAYALLASVPEGWSSSTGYTKQECEDAGVFLHSKYTWKPEVAKWFFLSRYNSLKAAIEQGMK